MQISSTNKNNQFKIWFGLVLTYLFIPIVLLVCGWDLGWWQAYIYSIIIFIAGVGGRVWAERRHPGIMQERLKIDAITEDVKPWDKILAPLLSISVSFPLYIVAGLDHRFRWSAEFPILVNIIGLILIASGYGIAVWALVENRFFSSVVRIQKDRGHTVCDSGPYRIIRHPGYSGNILPLLGIVLALGSWWTIIPSVIAVVIAVIRTELEDRTLKEELIGYKEYTQRVKYRLIPGIY